MRISREALLRRTQAGIQRKGLTREGSGAVRKGVHLRGVCELLARVCIPSPGWAERLRQEEKRFLRFTKPGTSLGSGISSHRVRNRHPAGRSIGRRVHAEVCRAVGGGPCSPLAGHILGALRSKLDLRCVASEVPVCASFACEHRRRAIGTCADLLGVRRGRACVVELKMGQGHFFGRGLPGETMRGPRGLRRLPCTHLRLAMCQAAVTAALFERTTGVAEVEAWVAQVSYAPVQDGAMGVRVYPVEPEIWECRDSLLRHLVHCYDGDLMRRKAGRSSLN